MEIKGKIIAVMPAKNGISQKNGEQWMSQEYVIETQEQYPKRCMFSVFGEDKIKLYTLAVGSEVIVSFDINAREYNGKWYNDIRAWKVTPANKPEQTQQQPTPSVEIPAPTEAPADNDDNLPF